MNQLEQPGFALVSDLVEAGERGRLLSALGSLQSAGRRDLLAISEVAAFARSPRVLALVRSHLDAEPIPERALYFDKHGAVNWLVPWHQDLLVAIRAKVESPGFGPWSVKDGIPHVQPPVALLERMLTLRLALDQADQSNGALRVLPGSHRFGLLSARRIQQLRGEGPEFLCVMEAGDALLMRPLLLHASSRSNGDHHRRVLHIEYAGFSLPAGLDWYETA